jgi:tRNA U34 2-thiouridine synthase MnmA/TrmU
LANLQNHKLEIAAEMDLITADKKRLTGLCFIGKVRLQILQQKITTKEGLIYEIDSASQYIP